MNSGFDILKRAISATILQTKDRMSGSAFYEGAVYAYNDVLRCIDKIERMEAEIVRREIEIKEI